MVAREAAAIKDRQSSITNDSTIKDPESTMWE
jgi:hypothetical protein